jgi:peptidoglycan/LPS O-acetylase OafA/YrhL
MLPKRLTGRFRRITTSGVYYPEIDGIRFMCIAMVMLCHVSVYVRTYITGPYDFQSSPLLYILSNGGEGVYPFFTLSGYILTVPFIKAKFCQQSSPSLKKYYLRRLTRLEPPYIISLILSFAVLVWVLNNFTFKFLFPHFLASLFYVHHIFFPQSNPPALPVAWTLEVEMMFYISLPFLLYLLYKLPTFYRRLIIFLIISVVPFLHQGLINYRFLPANLPYFLAGIMVAEHVVLEENPLALLPNVIKPWLLVVLLSSFFLTAYPGFNFNHSGISAITVYFVFVLIIIDKTGDQFFANKYIATIGGMCYSIYLTHYAVISFIGCFAHRSFFGGNFLLNFLIYTVIYLVPALVAAGLFYLLIEQPTMKKNWWKRAGSKAVIAGVKQ